MTITSMSFLCSGVLTPRKRARSSTARNIWSCRRRIRRRCRPIAGSSAANIFRRRINIWSHRTVNPLHGINWMSRKLIAFDFDGTLVESHIGYTQALKEFSEARGLPWDSMKMAKGYVDPWKYDLGWGLPLEQQVPVFEALNEFYFSEMNAANRFMPTLFENVLETLESLTVDYDMVVVTARERKSLHKVMDYYGLSRYFPYVRTKCCAFERGYAIKPAPDALLCVLKDTKHATTDVV